MFQTKSASTCQDCPYMIYETSAMTYNTSELLLFLRHRLHDHPVFLSLSFGDPSRCAPGRGRQRPPEYPCHDVDVRLFPKHYRCNTLVAFKLFLKTSSSTSSSFKQFVDPKIPPKTRYQLNAGKEEHKSKSRREKRDGNKAIEREE